jgi:hypothetical protein
MELHTKKCHKCIDVDFRKFRSKYHQIWITVDGGKSDIKFDCRLKREKQNVLHSNRPGPASHYATTPQLPLDGLTLKATYSVRQSDPKNI